MFKHPLGARARDNITGFSGTIIARIEYINGCLQYGIVPDAQDGKLPSAEYIDEGRVEVVSLPDNVVDVTKLSNSDTVAPILSRRGGPQRDAPR